MIDWTAVIVSLLTAIVGIGGPTLAYKQWKIETKAKAEAANRDAEVKSEEAKIDRNERLLASLQAEVERLSKDLNDNRDELKEARDEIRNVYEQVGQLRAENIEFKIGARILYAQLIEEALSPNWEFPRSRE